MMGSSPLSRGIHGALETGLQRRRIIPALAGNTGCVRRGGGSSRDHPRSRGEYISLGRHCGQKFGSSPLSRGILLRGNLWASQPGIIPALAGNTPHSSMARIPYRDHPRSRGEYTPTATAVSQRPGSSPLSRGIPGRGLTSVNPRGIIPALAGNTNSSAPPSPTDGDHPRSRGEYGFLRGWLGGVFGSSPLSRGIRLPPSTHLVSRGIIPALAGNTADMGAIYNKVADHPRSRGEYYSHLLLHLQ